MNQTFGYTFRIRITYELDLWVHIQKSYYIWIKHLGTQSCCICTRLVKRCVVYEMTCEPVALHWQRYVNTSCCICIRHLKSRVTYELDIWVHIWICRVAYVQDIWNVVSHMKKTSEYTCEYVVLHMYKTFEMSCHIWRRHWSTHLNMSCCIWIRHVKSRVTYELDIGVHIWICRVVYV